MQEKCEAKEGEESVREALKERDEQAVCCGRKPCVCSRVYRGTALVSSIVQPWRKAPMTQLIRPQTPFQEIPLTPAVFS